jgi:competence protein ComEC
VLRLPGAPRNPGEFDFPAFLRTRGILAEIVTADSSGVRVTGQDAGHPLVAAAGRARERIRRAITLDLAPTDPEVAGVIAAMVLGAREDAPQEMVDDFKVSGTLHLFAVSGLHVGMIAFILLALLRIPRTPRRLAAVIVIVALVFYAFVTGLRPSAVRATVMATILLSGLLVDRPARILNSLGAAALLILALDPFQALAPGFQLSFSVLLAIALLTAPLQRLAAPFVNPDPFLPRALLSRNSLRFHAGARKITDTLAVSTAASLGSLPLMLAYFHLATPIAVVTNCVLIPLAFCLIFTAVISALVQLITLPGLGVTLNNANFLLVKAIAAVIAVAASVPGGHFYASARPWFVREACEIEVLDIPQGGGAHAIQTRSGARWIVDTGSARLYDGLLAPYLRSAGLNRLDGLILTHGDSHHTGAADRVLGAYRPRETFLSLKDLRSPGIRSTVTILSDKERSPKSLRQGDVVRLDRQTEIRVLFPPTGHESARADDHCLVLLLVCGDSRVLFSGDSGFSTERWLLENIPADELRAEVLVTGRHRSDPGAPTNFLSAVRPRAIVSTNSDTPAAERIPSSLRTHCENDGIRLFDQAKTGAVHLSVSPREITLTGFLAPDPFHIASAEDEARPVDGASDR